MGYGSGGFLLIGVIFLMSLGVVAGFGSLPPRVPVEKLTDAQKVEVATNGRLGAYGYDEIEQLQAMVPPVKLYSRTDPSRWTRQLVLVDGLGHFHTFSGEQWDSFKVGDVLK
jgi:uncharacterized Ntn-hydrolase superfamily protein